MGCLELFLHWDTRAQSLSQRIYGSEKLRLLESGPLQERFTDPLLQDNSCMFFLKRSETEGGRKAARSSRADSVTTETPISLYSWCCALPRSPFYLHGPALVLPFPSQALFSWFTSVSGETAPISGLTGCTAFCCITCQASDEPGLFQRWRCFREAIPDEALFCV